MAFDSSDPPFAVPQVPDSLNPSPGGLIEVAGHRRGRHGFRHGNTSRAAALQSAALKCLLLGGGGG